MWGYFQTHGIFMLNIVLFGAPGAGKGTQTERLVAKYGFNHISTGEIIREEIKRESELGLSMKDYIARGEFAPDSLVIKIIEKYVTEHDHCKGNIFDGFPRTTAQAEAFDEILQQSDMFVDSLISIDVEDDLLRERLLLRGQQTGRADDASLEVINNRISIYKTRTEPVLDFYKNQRKYTGIDGIGTPDEVYERICQEIDKLLSLK